MKTNSFLSTLVALASVQLIHSAPVELAPTIVEIGPHHRVWERSIDQVLPDGSVLQDKTGFTELCTGLYYTDETGQLRESQPVFELLPGAAVARKTQIQAILAANFNSAGAIDLLLPNRVRLTGHCLGLSYYDRAVNTNVLIAEV